MNFSSLSYDGHLEDHFEVICIEPPNSSRSEFAPLGRNLEKLIPDSNLAKFQVQNSVRTSSKLNEIRQVCVVLSW
jgi:hypothetical protein